MKTQCIIMIIFMIVPCITSACFAADNVHTLRPIGPYPENPRYLMFRDKPTILISPAEHYGAVINMDFDYVPYLNTLAEDGFNLTRLFVGSYVELDESISFLKGYDNTLAPRPNRLLTPWARSTTPGYSAGGNKFDLDKWDPSYFARLKDFIHQASIRNIAVEVVLFSQQYNELNWSASPLNSINNINNLPVIPWYDFNTLACEPLVTRQEALTNKLVTELVSFDNVYYEICNEPNFQKVGVKQSAEWAKRILDSIYNSEPDLPYKHMTSFQDASVLTDPRISLYNFHYAYGDTWVGAMQGLTKYYKLGKAMAFDETADVLAGQPLSKTRTDGWEFLLGGGAVYDHLSWAYTPDNETGNSDLGRETRRQFRTLKEFMNSLNFTSMKPANSIVKGGVPKNGNCRVLADPGNTYAIHITGGTKVDLMLELPEGQYSAEWIDTCTGVVLKAESIMSNASRTKVSSPDYQDDIALRITRVNV